MHEQTLSERTAAQVDSQSTTESARRTPAPILEVRQVHKQYGGVVALDGVNFELLPGECMGLVGDNGAGKSTLIKSISGAVNPDSGEILLSGKPVQFQSPLDARDAGIETVYQDLALAPSLDATSNIFLGRELLKPGLLGRLGFLDRSAMEARTRELLSRLNVRLRSIHYPISSLSGGQRQGVAIARSIAWHQRVLILDEPTAALGVEQTQMMINLINHLKQQQGENLSIILITHDLPRIFEVADRITVMRQGRRVAVVRAEETTTEGLVALMTGASV